MNEGSTPRFKGREELERLKELGSIGYAGKPLWSLVRVLRDAPVLDEHGVTIPEGQLGWVREPWEAVSCVRLPGRFERGGYERESVLSPPEGSPALPVWEVWVAGENLERIDPREYWGFESEDDPQARTLYITRDPGKLYSLFGERERYQVAFRADLHRLPGMVRRYQERYGPSLRIERSCERCGEWSPHVYGVDRFGRVCPPAGVAANWCEDCVDAAFEEAIN